MAQLTLDLTKSIEENASAYFDKAKKTKKKIEGATEALEATKKQLQAVKKQEQQFITTQKLQEKTKQRAKAWYEKFRWFRSSNGFLVVGGRDATSNEVLIKKHTDIDDLVFHTDMTGSPFFVVKAAKQEIPGPTIQEAADATCTFSKAWKLGMQTTPVFYVMPEQVSKKAPSGEYVAKGAFMIYGKTNYVSCTANLAIGVTNDNALMAGPENAVKQQCRTFVIIKQGTEKASSITKKIQHILGKQFTADDIIRVLPAGSFSLAR